MHHEIIPTKEHSCNWRPTAEQSVTHNETSHGKHTTKDHKGNDTWFVIDKSNSLASIDRVTSVWKLVRNYTAYLMTCEPAAVSARQVVCFVEPDNQHCHHLHIIV